MWCRVPPASLALSALFLTGCASKREVAAPAPVAVPAPPIRTAVPLPPDGAAAGLTIPARLADGSYATPNRAVSAAGAIWHLRAAFNVAALNCPNATLVPAYNGWLKTHRVELAVAHRTLSAEIGAAQFDTAMTRLYNYFAQPPVLARFCATAGPLLQQGSTLAPGALVAFAPPSLEAIDRPFGEFYARYDAYRTALAAWGSDGAPRLAYDRTVLAGSSIVTGGRTTLAAR